MNEGTTLERRKLLNLLVEAGISVKDLKTYGELEVPLEKLKEAYAGEIMDLEEENGEA